MVKKTKKKCDGREPKTGQIKRGYRPNPNGGCPIKVKKGKKR